MAISTHPGQPHPAMTKSGFRKIVKTCELARADNLDYAWVDTCCIDKSSSAELSEAINSMFQWYKAAAICYAHLSDLPNGDNLAENLHRCRWFTRGWCLQELIAPRDVLFLDGDWRLVGSKTSPKIRSLVSGITMIADAVLLDPEGLHKIAVAQKMSWAANRETTRIEDMAYCLLGIFDINMPMLYGEGNKAFRRLQEEIIKRSNDLSIFAWNVEGPDAGATPSPPPPKITPAHLVNLFAESPRDFVGCHFLQKRPSSVQRNYSFSMTNNGLLFSGADFHLDFSHGLFALVLSDPAFYHPINASRWLVLKRVGFNKFARVRYPGHSRGFKGCEATAAASRDSSDLEVYVIPDTRDVDFDHHRPTKPDTDSLLEYVYLHSRLAGNARANIYSSVLDMSPKEWWDASLCAFVFPINIYGIPRGYVKFDGANFLRARGMSSGAPRVGDFYLIWELRYKMGNMHTTLTSSSRDTISREAKRDPDLRLKLYREDEWTCLPRITRAGVNYSSNWLDPSGKLNPAYVGHGVLALGPGHVKVNAGFLNVPLLDGRWPCIDVSYEMGAPRPLELTDATPQDQGGA